MIRMRNGSETPARKRRSDGERSREAILRDGRSARHRRGHRRALHRPPGRGRGDEQERAVRPLRLQGGAAARDDRGGERALRRAGGRPGARGADRHRAAATRSSRTTCGTSRTTSTRAAASSPRSMPELDTHPGAVRDRALAFMGSWLGHIETADPRRPGRGRDRSGGGCRAARLRDRGGHDARERDVRDLTGGDPPRAGPAGDRATARRGRSEGRVGASGATPCVASSSAARSRGR